MHKKFLRDLKDFERQIDNHIARGVRETLQVIQSQAVALAPVDSSSLRDSIHISVASDGKSGRVQVGAKHAIYVEFGTGVYATKGGSSQPWAVKTSSGEWFTTRGQEPQPFWQPALEAGEMYFKRYFR